MKTLMIKTHEVWLETLMAGFMSHTSNKKELIDFSDILFRHFTWLENELIVLDESYTYDRDTIPVKVEKLSDILHNIVIRLNEIDLQLMSSPDRELAGRIASDIHYIRDVISHMDDEIVTAFNMEGKYSNILLNQEATDALKLFLVEESCKEYKHIMIYNYLKAYSDDTYMNRIFQIFIDESFVHFKSFGDMMSDMGLLALPQVVMKELYQVEDVVVFLKNSIDEELTVKEKCTKLSKAVAQNSKELEMFFTFINNQKSYHIALAKDALEHFEKENNV